MARRVPISALLFLLACLSWQLSTAAAQSPEDRLRQAVERAKRATLGIMEATPEGRQAGFQTGFSLRGTAVHLRNGFILTVRHAVERQDGASTVLPETIMVLTQRLEELQAKLVGGHAYLDVVLYKLPAMPESLESADLLFSVEDARPGQEVFTLGYPLGWGPAVAFGHVGNPMTFLPTVETRLLQTDVPACSGNSGGGLFDVKGDLVALMHAIIKTDEIKGGYGCSRLTFAVPAVLARKVVDALIEGRQPGFSRLGIQMRPVKAGNRWRLTVGGVGEPAAQAGVQKGDLLLAIDETEIVDAAQLKNYLIERTTPGQKVTLRVLRGDQQVALTVTLGAG